MRTTEPICAACFQDWCESCPDIDLLGGACCCGALELSEDDDDEPINS